MIEHSVDARVLRLRLAQMLEKDEQFRQAALVARKNSYGGLWLIGGAVFRRLAHIEYGTEMSAGVDFDFLVGRMHGHPTIPDGWKVDYNAFGNPKFVGKNISVDFCPLPLVHSILRRNLEPTIENWMTGTPLNIQSVMFDCNTCELRGNVGLLAVFSKVVAVNDHIQAQIYADRKKKTVAQIIREKAAELNFEPQLPI